MFKNFNLLTDSVAILGFKHVIYIDHDYLLGGGGGGGDTLCQN
jgi:hypothetical protein